MEMKPMSMPSTAQAWMMAVRLRTLWIPTIQIITAVAVATTIVSEVNWSVAFCAWLVAMLITVATNLLNDVFDFEKGGDPLKRLGYVKVLRLGVLSKRQVYTAGILALIAACLLPLIFQVSWIIIALVLLSAVCSYCYTGGPFPISYLGLSELFIFLFYGLVCIITTVFALTQQVSFTAVLTAVQMGLLAILPNALNNFRDIHDDAEVNKHTLAVRFGKTFARWEIALLTLIPFLLNLIWLFLGYSEAALIPLLLLPLAFIFVRGVWITDPGPVFNRYFALSVMVHFLFGVFLTVGISLG